MKEFKDEFVHTDNAVKPTPLAQYVKLKDSEIIERDLDTFSDPLQQEAIHRYKIIALVDKENKGGWTQKNLDPILDKIFAADMSKRPNWRTLVRWRQSYLENGGGFVSLVSKRHAMGNRKSRVEGDEVVFEKALARFLDSKRPSIIDAYRYYCDSIELLNEGVVEGKIPKISYTAFRKRVQSLPPYPVALARHGKFTADQWFAYCSSHIPPTRILERVEIDHTPLDVILIDDDLLVPIGRPYLTLLIDVFSGCILGFHLSYKSPSYVSVAKAIVHATKPKNLEGLSITLQNSWPCFGKIETLVVDNGAEFWSYNLEQACRESGINVQYNPVRKPWLKPIIERFFGVINKYFLSDFPGKTFSNILEREEYNPQKDAVIRFSTFVEEFHRWIVDIYHQDANSRQTRMPILRWKQSFDSLPPLKMEPEDEKRFDTYMWISTERTLTKNGFKYEELMYESVALAEYRMNYPQTKESAEKLIKVNPDDLSSIRVYLEELNGYLTVPCDDPVGYTKGLSLHEHKVIKAYNREVIRESMNPLGLAKARMAMRDRIKNEQELFAASKGVVRIKNLKKHAQFVDISNTGQGTIKIEHSDSLVEPKKHSPTSTKKNNFLESWDDDASALEAF